MAVATLREHFLDRLEAPLQTAFAGLSDLEKDLADLVAQTPNGLGLDAFELIDAVATRLAATDLEDPRAALASFRPSDLTVALACARGVAAAIELFEREHGAEIDRAIRKSPTLGLSVDEFRQIIREKLFVANVDEAPKIASYGGRAPLASWVRVTCARTVIDLARRKDDRTTSADDEWLAQWPDSDDPELRLLRERHASLLPDAFRAALQKLSPRQRNLLRQRFLHDISAETLAATYGVHRATVFAWIELARKDLMNQVRAALRASVAKTSLESLVEVIGSAMELSIRRLLDSKIETE